MWRGAAGRIVGHCASPASRPAKMRHVSPDLEEFYAHAWLQLVRGVPDTRHGFHWPVLATVDGEGAPSARVVVLRAAEPDAGELVFHTDRRAPKVEQVRRRASVALTFHDGRRKLQVRVRAAAAVHVEGPAYEAGWQRIGSGSRRCYLAPRPPSTPAAACSANLPPHLVGKVPTAEEAEAGRARFAVVVCAVTSLDVLELGRLGHRRARFDLATGRVVAATWLEP